MVKVSGCGPEDMGSIPIGQPIFKGGSMKVKVIRAYIDKNTREFCGLDEILDYPKERAEELIKDGAVVKYKPTKAPEKVTVQAESIS